MYELEAVITVKCKDDAKDLRTVEAEAAEKARLKAEAEEKARVDAEATEKERLRAEAAAEVTRAVARKLAAEEAAMLKSGGERGDNDIATASSRLKVLGEKLGVEKK